MEQENKVLNEETNTPNVAIEEEKANNKRNVFNIIIGIATLLIALLGATFAYFSATARSKDDDVNVKSAYVSISFDGGTEIKASHLIPATETVAINKFMKSVTSIGTEDDESLEFISEDDYTNDLARRCVDALGREVCYVYRFSIDSDGEAGGYTGIAGGIKVNKNDFTNLSYILYEVTYRTQNDKFLVDKFGNKVVDSFQVISEFNKTDTNPDNVDYVDTKFATFAKPFDKPSENQEYLDTVYPVECLFGYSETYDDEKEDDLKRCKVHRVTNQTKHYYEVLIWLEETGQVQEEQGMEFKGTVLLEVPGGQADSEYPDGKITGKD